MLLKLVLKFCSARLRVILFVSSILFLGQFAAKAGVVTNFTQTDFLIALTNGGPVTFLTDGTLTVTSTVPILTNIVIDGAGHSVIISGGGSTNVTDTNMVGVRVFFVTNNVTLTLRNITISSGRSTNGAGIYNAGNVNMSNCVLAANIAIGAVAKNGLHGKDFDPPVDYNGKDGGNGTLGMGGGIYNLGTVSITNSIISGNGAGGSSGGSGGNGGRGGGRGGDGGNAALGAGGGIYNLGTVFVTNSTFVSNVAGGGDGGLGGLADNVFLDGASGIGAAGYGGGIFNLGALTINNSTFFRNTVVGGDTGHAADKGLDESDGGNGGSAFGGGIYNRGTANITNSTFTDNISRGGKGGDVFIRNLANAGNGGAARGGAIYNSNSVVIVNCTIATNNTVGGERGISPAGGDRNGDPGVSQGGNIYRQLGQVRLRNTILAKGTNGSNYGGTVVDDGYNLSSDTTPTFIAGSGSLKSANPGLGSLTNNGGINLTMALLRTSQAIDAGDPSFCLPTDQRGIVRPQGTRCDIGAYEREPAFDISGLITDGTNKLSGVTIVATSNSVTNGAVSITNGTYTIRDLIPGTYTVTAGPSYTPSNYVVTVSGDVTNRNFSYVGAKAASPSYLTNLNGTFIFVVATKPSQPFQVQSSTNLIDWNDFTLKTNEADGAMSVGDTNSAVFRQRFFRIRIP